MTPEQLETLRTCDTPASVLEFVKNEGIELTDEDLDKVSGGGWDDPIGIYCPKCHSMLFGVKRGDAYTCGWCGYTTSGTF